MLEVSWLAGDPTVRVGDGGVGVFVRDTADHLRQFSFAGGGPWEVFDLSADVGGVLVAGDPTVRVGDGGVGVFVRDTADHLRQFWFAGGGPWEVSI